MNVLVTGGAGYIGSHTCVELLERGHNVIVIDNLVNSNVKAIERVEQITGKNVAFYENDVRDRAALDRIFEKHGIDCAIHFAGLKAVGESVEMPLEYYANNLFSTVPWPSWMRALVTKGRKYSAFSGFTGSFASSQAGKRFFSWRSMSSPKPQKFMETRESPESSIQVSPSSVKAASSPRFAILVRSTTSVSSAFSTWQMPRATVPCSVTVLRSR